MVVKAEPIELDESKELDITGYSIAHILDLLDKHNWDYKRVKNGYKVRNIDAKDISEGKGYMSRVFICTVEFEHGREYKFALKVPTMEYIEEINEKIDDSSDEDKQIMVDALRPCHNRECDVLKLLSDIEGFPTAKVYHVQKNNTGEPSGLKGKFAPGMILMSVLTGITPGFFTTANGIQLLNLADCFASLHNYIDTLPKEKWIDICQGDYHFMDPLGNSIEEQIPILKEKWPKISDALDTLYSFDPIKYSYYAIRDRATELNAVTALNGDFQPNNMMWNVNEDGNIANTCHAIYDFQLITHGNPMFDLARFIVCGTDPDVYREHVDHMIQRYHDKLTELAEKRGTKPKYTVEDCKELFELAFVHQSYQMIIMVHFFSKIDVPGDADVVEAQRAKMENRLFFTVKDAAETVNKRRGQLVNMDRFK